MVEVFSFICSTKMKSERLSHYLRKTCRLMASLQRLWESYSATPLSSLQVFYVDWCFQEESSLRFMSLRARERCSSFHGVITAKWWADQFATPWTMPPGSSPAGTLRLHHWQSCHALSKCPTCSDTLCLPTLQEFYH